MKRLEPILILLAVMLAFLLLAAPAEAGGCRVVVRRVAVVNDHHAVQQRITVTKTLAATEYPSYGAYYNEGAAEDRKLLRDVLSQNQQLIEKYATLAERTRGAVQPTGPTPQLKGTQPMEKEPDQTVPPEQSAGDEGLEAEVTKLFVARCAGCHEAATKKKGGGFTLLAGGKIAPLTDRLLKELLVRCYSDDPEIAMPKGGKSLADQDVAAVFKYVASRK